MSFDPDAYLAKKAQAFDPDAYLAKRAPPPPPAPPGMGESLARGAGQGATLGFGDEINAGVQALGIKALGQTGAQKSLGQLYRENRDAFRRENAAAKAAHPYVYGAGQFAGSAPLALATGGIGGGSTKALIGTSAALGGASALGESTEEGLGGQALDTAKGAAIGAAIPAAITGIGRAVPAATNALRQGAIGTARRILVNKTGSLSAAKALPAEVVQEVLDSGVIRPLGTSAGAAERLQGLRETVGDQYGQILDTLEKAGVRGPDAQAMADKYMRQAAAAKATSLNKSVPRVFRSAGEQLREMAMPPGAGKPIPAPLDVPMTDSPALRTFVNERPIPVSVKPAPRIPAAIEESPGAKGLRGALDRWGEDEIPHSVIPPAPTPSPGPLPGAWPEGAAVQVGMADDPALREIAAQRASDEFRLGGGQRLSLSRAEQLKRSLQGMAKSAYKKMEPGEVGQAHEAAASMMRQAIEDEIAQQAPGAGPVAQEAAAAFEPVKSRLSKLIAAGNVAREGANRAANRNAFSLRDALIGLGGMAHGGAIEGIGAGVGGHLLTSRGPSTAASAMNAGANALDYLTGPATNAAQARTQALIAALRNRALPLAAEEAGGSTSR